jgi:Mor family transcriptional regulator
VRRKKLTRNQGLIAEFEAGRTIDQLTAKYDLSENRVRAILADERNRRIASALPFYREFRYRQGPNIT